MPHATIERVDLIVGLEVHVELATRTKMFTRAPSPACAEFEDAPPNTLIDPVVLGLPGALPVMNHDAVEMAMLVGLALNCSIAQFTKWDRKSYYYPDLPKAYQISQYDLPLCFDGEVEVPVGHLPGAADARAVKRVGIIRAHLEEDAGKLLHEAPGGLAIDHSIVDFNRAGAPLLEIVTQPDFTSSDDTVAFARFLRNICRFLGVSEGVMQKGHMRFEPNINTILTLRDGRTVKTPIVEIKNLNSFRALKGAIDFEAQDQPGRYVENGLEMAPGAKTTRGWDDAKSATYVQREKEEAADYRYFPDPDLIPVVVDDAWRERVRSRLPELPHERAHRYEINYTLSHKEAMALTDERDVCLFYEDCVAAAVAIGVEEAIAGKQCANALLQVGQRLANEKSILVSDLGATAAQVAGLVKLRLDDAIGSTAADELFALLLEEDASPETLAEKHNLLQVRDDAALDSWCEEAIADPANAKVVEDIKGGKHAGIGRLMGAVMKRSGGAADAKAVQKKLREKLGL